jgi:cadmium resistance protein CadD (predicted permease)
VWLCAGTTPDRQSRRRTRRPFSDSYKAGYRRHPAFTGHAPAVLGGYVGVFLLLVGVWCAVGRYLTRHSIIAGLIGRWSEIIYPVALIAIGLAILIAGDAFGM